MTSDGRSQEIDAISKRCGDLAALARVAARVDANSAMRMRARLRFMDAFRG